MIEKVKKQEYWLEQNREWESSGLAQQNFCELRGLSYRAFVYWRNLLKEQNISDSRPKLIKIATTVARLKPQAVNAPDSGLEVTLPTGIKLCIKTEGDIRKASALIQLLGGVQ